jgi:hypothetical protein
MRATMRRKERRESPARNADAYATVALASPHMAGGASLASPLSGCAASLCALRCGDLASPYRASPNELGAIVLLGKSHAISNIARHLRCRVLVGPLKELTRFSSSNGVAAGCSLKRTFQRDPCSSSPRRYACLRVLFGLPPVSVTQPVGSTREIRQFVNER